MIIEPKIRGFICTNAHPEGCAKSVVIAKDYVAKQDKIASIKNVLVIGSSTGYGLASRIVSAVACDSNTLGVCFEKEPSEKRTASAGYYNTVAFHDLAKEKGLYAETINGDAFSDDIKQQVITKIKQNMGKIDLVVYSLASPRRVDPKTGEIYQSALKPIGGNVCAKTLDTSAEEIFDIELQSATEEEITGTVKVMGGEDWELWIEALLDAELLNTGCQTLSYTYLGCEITWPIYGKATIGRAKEDLDRAAAAINKKIQAVSGRARVAVLKGVVTQASSAIPMMPLYISILYKVMKKADIHEGCIEQIHRLFSSCVYSDSPTLDSNNRLRVDDWECRDDIQQAVNDIWQKVNTDNLHETTDFIGYQREFLHLFGFGYEDVDYQVDVNHLKSL